MKNMHFYKYPNFVKLLKSLGFIQFGPGHSASNGYEFTIDKRRVCFYDNTIFGDDRIEFRVMDYTKHYEYKKAGFGLFNRIDKGHRYGILSLFFNSPDEIIDIELLINVAKNIE